MSDDTPAPPRSLIPIQIRDDLTPEQVKQVEEGIVRNQPKPGPTGAYPEGRINADDQGEIAIACAADPRGQRVVLDFGTQIKWLAFTPAQARSLATLLRQKADAVEQVM